MSAKAYIETIYFDTNALLAAGWPRPSSQLLEVISQAEELGLRLGLPTTVKCELEEHWFREVRQKFVSAKNAADSFNRAAAGTIELPKFTLSLDRNALLKHLAQILGNFTARFESVPQTERPLAAIVTLAIGRAATFKEHGNGFQDAVILCSIIEHMHSNKSGRAILVSNDSAFSSDAAVAFVEKEGVTLDIIKDLDGIGAWLKEQFSERVRAYLEEEKRRMLEAVEEMKSELEAHLRERLRFAQDDLPIHGTLKQVSALKLVSIDDAHRAHPIFKDGHKGESVEQISVDVTVRLTVETERYRSAPAPKFRIGAQVVTEPISSEASLLSLLNILNPEANSTTCDVAVTVDADATRTDKGFEKLKFGWPRLKRESLGLLGALANG